MSSEEMVASMDRSFSPTRMPVKVQFPVPAAAQQPPPPAIDDPWVDLEKYASSIHSGESAGANSVRRFTYFPTHVQNYVQPWVDEGCRIHLMGRIVRGPDATKQSPRNTHIASWIKSLSPIRTTASRTAKPTLSPKREGGIAKKLTSASPASRRKSSPPAPSTPQRPTTPTRATPKVRQSPALPSKPPPFQAALEKPAASPLLASSRLQGASTKNIPRGAFSSHDIMGRASKVARVSGW